MNTIITQRLAKLGLASVLLAFIPAATAITSGSAEATLTVNNNWGSGYCAQVDIKAGNAPVTNWTITLNTAGTQINNLWNGSLSGGVVTPLAWNKTIAANNAVNFGFCANGSGTPSIASFTATGTNTSVAASSFAPRSSSSSSILRSSSSLNSSSLSSSSLSSSSLSSSSLSSSSKISSSVKSSSSSSSGNFSLVFRDDFNSFNSSRWQLMTHSWSGNLALFAASPVSVANGMMKLELNPAPAGTQSGGETKPYLGAEVRSVDTISYGRVSARAKLAKGSAVVSALVTIYTPWPADNWNEFDIESLGKNTNEIQFNSMVYTGPKLTPPVTASVTPTQYPSLQQLGFDSSQDFHVYTIEWTPKEATFLIDGVVYHRWVDRMDLMGLPQNILMTIWASNSPGWAGSVTSDTVNAEALYDWIEVWRYNP